MGATNGLFTLSPAAIVKIGSIQLNIVPYINILPMPASHGRFAKCNPSGVNLFVFNSSAFNSCKRFVADVIEFNDGGSTVFIKNSIGAPRPNKRICKITCSNDVRCISGI